MTKNCNFIYSCFIVLFFYFIYFCILTMSISLCVINYSKLFGLDLILYVQNHVWWGLEPPSSPGQHPNTTQRNTVHFAHWFRIIRMLLYVICFLSMVRTLTTSAYCIISLLLAALLLLLPPPPSIVVLPGALSERRPLCSRNGRRYQLFTSLFI